MRRIAQVLIIVFIAIFIIPFFLPNTINVSVERDFKVQAGMIFEDFNNLNEFSKWEPWTYNDTTAQKNFFSPYRGEGAGYRWNTKNKNGTLTITKIGRATSELQSRGHLVCRLLLEINNT